MFKMKYKIYPYSYYKNRNHEVLYLLKNLVVQLICQVWIGVNWNNIPLEMMPADTVVVEQYLMLVCCHSVVMWYC